MLAVVTGAPFAGKRLWVDREIEQAEEQGAVGQAAVDFTALYSALVPGAQSILRDQRITDSGAARFAAFLYAAAFREANARELDAYALTDSPRRAVSLAAAAGDAPLVEVVTTRDEAHRRSREHVELVRDLTDRAGAEDGKAAVAKCRQMVDQYFRERDVLPAGTRQVTAPDVPSDRAIQYMWTAALKAAKRGDTERRDKWTSAARRALAARGIAA